MQRHSLSSDSRRIAAGLGAGHLEDLRQREAQVGDLVPDKWIKSEGGVFTPTGVGPSVGFSRPIAIHLFPNNDDKITQALITNGMHVVAAVAPDPSDAVRYLYDYGHGWGPHDVKTPQRLFIDCPPEAADANEAAIRAFVDQGPNRPPRLAGQGWRTAHQLLSADYLPGVFYAYTGDLRQLTAERIYDGLRRVFPGLHIGKGSVTTVYGSPKCVPFTVTTGTGKVMDPLRSEVLHFARLVAELGPRQIILANGAAMADMVTTTNKPVVRAFRDALIDGGWTNAKAFANAMATSPALRDQSTGRVPQPKKRATKGVSGNPARSAAQQGEAEARATGQGEQEALFIMSPEGAVAAPSSSRRASGRSPLAPSQAELF